MKSFVMDITVIYSHTCTYSSLEEYHIYTLCAIEEQNQAIALNTNISSLCNKKYVHINTFVMDITVVQSHTYSSLEEYHDYTPYAIEEPKRAIALKMEINSLCNEKYWHIGTHSVFRVVIIVSLV